jgi:hypothetical protein
VRVGYARTTIAKVAEQGRELIRTRNFTRTEWKRGGQNATQELTITSWDTPDGEPVRFETRMSNGTSSPDARPMEVVAVGGVRDGQLGIDVTTLGRTESLKLPWRKEWGGLFAPEQSLRQRPLKPGESRTIRSLLPIFNMPGDTRLVAESYETVELPGLTQAQSASEGSTGTTKLLKITSTLEVGQQRSDALVGE